MALMAALEADLRALSAESRRRHPAVKDAAEHAILKVSGMFHSPLHFVPITSSSIPFHVCKNNVDTVYSNFMYLSLLDN